MRLGGDTGFFVRYANGNPPAVRIWQELDAGIHTLVVSTLTISELLPYFFRRGNGKQAQEWVELVSGTEAFRVVPVSIEIASQAARYRHSLGLPTVDSVILSTFVSEHCDEVLTTDGHFSIVSEQKILSVRFL